MSRCPGCGMKECCGADLEPQLQAAKERIRALREALKYIAQHVDLDKDFNHIWTIEAKHAMSALQSDDKGAT